MKRSIVQLLALLVLSVSFVTAQSRGYDEVCLGANTTYVASPISCEYYYLCLDGTAYGYSCDDGKWFSTELQACVSPEESDCEIEQAPELPTAPPPTPSPVCDGVPSYTYVRSMETCQYYYMCIDQVAYLLSCPKGFWFNQEAQRCGNRYEFECDLEPSTPTPPPPPPNPCADQPNFGFIQDPSYCYRFSMCMNGYPFPMVCWDGLWFDYEAQTCVDPSETECGATTPPPNPPPPAPEICRDVEDGLRVLHYRFCNEYFTCNGEVGTPTICPDGDWFDEQSQACVHPMDAYCPHGGQQRPPTPNVCRGVDDGDLVPAPDSCSYYYVCANEEGYRVACPPDQYFDVYRQSCEYSAICNL
ncbi:hypothetical protein quinque_007990 [Culex quinquefasciatus]